MFEYIQQNALLMFIVNYLNMRIQWAFSFIATVSQSITSVKLGNVCVDFGVYACNAVIIKLFPKSLIVMIVVSQIYLCPMVLSLRLLALSIFFFWTNEKLNCDLRFYKFAPYFDSTTRQKIKLKHFKNILACS